MVILSLPQRVSTTSGLLCGPFSSDEMSESGLSTVHVPPL